MPRTLHHHRLSELYIAKAIVNIMQVKKEYFPVPIYTTYVKSVHEGIVLFTLVPKPLPSQHLSKCIKKTYK